MILVYVPIIYFTTLYIFMWKKQKTINVGSIVLLLYIVSSFCSVILVYNTNNEFSGDWNLDVISTFLYCALLTLVIIPVYDFRSDKIEIVELEESKRKIYQIIAWIIIIFTFISLITSYNAIVGTMNQDLLEVRDSFYKQALDYSYTRASQSFLQYFISIGPTFSPILLMFFFYGIIYLKEKKILNIMLLASSTVLPITGIVNASRTEVIYWIITYVALYVTFRPQMNSQDKWLSKLIMIVLSAFAMTYFAAVTISRFGKTSLGVNNSIIFYIGQPYLQFSKVFEKFIFSKLTFDRTFPIVTKYIFGHDFNITQFRINETYRLGTATNVFFTFLGDAMLDYGRFGMIVYTFLLFAVEKCIFKRKDIKKIKLYQMILVVLVLRVPLLGIFAYVYKSTTTSLFIIGSLFVVFLLKYKITFIKNKKSQ